jgi:REP element-mobilizing transposase RayT
MKRAYECHPHILLVGRSLCNELLSFMAEKSNKLNCPVLTVGGEDDHVPILRRLNGATNQSDWVKEVKRISCNWLKHCEPRLRKF